MAELIMTDEEKTADLWSELDDATLGKLTRVLLANQMFPPCPKNMKPEEWEFRRITGYNAALVLVGLSCRGCAESLDLKLRGVKITGVALGDWKISVRKLRRKPCKDVSSAE